MRKRAVAYRLSGYLFGAYFCCFTGKDMFRWFRGL